MDKYYTPTIEEFHVGFECQLFVKGAWKDAAIEMDYAGNLNAYGGFPKMQYLYMILADNYNDKIRVKYLDREDIESLGWKETKERVNIEGCDEFKITIGNSTYFLWKVSKVYGRNKWLIELQQAKNFFTCFRGAIKNKSELKKILQMVGALSPIKSDLKQ